MAYGRDADAHHTEALSSESTRRWPNLCQSEHLFVTIYGSPRVRLERTPTLQRSADGHLVRVLKVPAHRQAPGQACEPGARAGEQLADVHRRALAFQIRVRCEDHLLDAAALHALDKLRDLEIVRADTVHRRDRAVEHVEASFELSGAFDREHVERFFHDADDLRVALV